MKSSEFILQARTIASVKTRYAFGCTGQKITSNLIAQKAAQYPAWYTKERKSSLLSDAGCLAFDCSGLIKYILRNESFPDINADTIFKTYCEKVNIPGAGCLAHKKGHIGICLNDHQVVEASSSSGAVVISDNSSRNWEEFGKFNFLQFDNFENEKLNQFISDLKELINKYEGG